MKVGRKIFPHDTILRTNNLPLKIDGLKTTFILGRPIFRGEPLVSGRGTTSYCSTTLYGSLGFSGSNQTFSNKSCEGKSSRTGDLRFERNTKSIRSIMVSK